MSAPNALRISKVFRFLAENYFRSELHSSGELSLSSGRPVIFIANHSGMAFSWDAHILREELVGKFGDDAKLKRLVAPDFFQNKLIQHFGIQGFRPLDSVPANRSEFDNALVVGGNVLMFPEGIAGIAKGFDKRYQMQKFSSSVVRMAIKHRADIVFVSVVNGEYLNPFAYSVDWVNKLAKKAGLPFLPVGLFSINYLLFPWGLYASMPAKLKFILSSRIPPTELSEKPYSELTDIEIRQISSRLQESLQNVLHKNVELFGEKKFDLFSLLKSAWSLGPKSLFLLPLVWPVLFQMSALAEHASLSQRLKAAFVGIFQMVPVLGWPLFLIYLKLTPTNELPVSAEESHKRVA